jgi:hypothetical protein
MCKTARSVDNDIENGRRQTVPEMPARQPQPKSRNLPTFAMENEDKKN